MEEPFMITLMNSKRINKGVNALVYLIGDEAIKVPKFSYWDNRLEQEYTIQKTLYERGYPIPKAYGIFPVKISRKFFTRALNKKGFFMERIYGKDLTCLLKRPELFEEAEEIVRKIEVNEGIKIDSFYWLHPRNVMYDEKKKRVVLIDFGNWKMS